MRMPPRASERAPLLSGDYAGSSTNTFTEWIGVIILWIGIIIDMFLFLPSGPTEMALRHLAQEYPYPGEANSIIFLGLWSLFSIVFAVVTALAGYFGPFLIVSVVSLLSFFYFHILEALYKHQVSRTIIRIVAFMIILSTLWKFVDLRHEFTPEDLPALFNSRNSIRVLDVWPAKEQRAIETNLRTVRLADNPTFEALSYEWGNPSRSHSISVAGKRFRVTNNLWNALHNVRQESETRTLWVDAVCIDQTNLDEKSSQVPLMSLIYRRAQRVLISLGKHTPPHWVSESNPSTWTSAWIDTTVDYNWDSTRYWLEQLMLEEYWKRCWVVQEIGLGLSIEVYAQRTSIPWERFIELTTKYGSKVPTSKPANRVLRFNSLREAMYQDGRTYVLAQLLEEFKDSFCSVNLDKILAFVGMAVDCEGECIPVDYTGGAMPLYEALIFFQNSTTHQSPNGSIEMIYFASLVRRLLSRQQVKVVQEHKKPGLLYEPGTWTYDWCGDDNVVFCQAQSAWYLMFWLLLDVLWAPLSALKDTKISSSIWLPDMAEVKSTWLSAPVGYLDQIKLLGAIVGQVKELGPAYADFLRDPTASRQWSARLSQLYPDELDQRRARGLNARFSAILGPAADYRLADVVNLPSEKETSDEVPGGPRLFLGGDDIIMGLAPSNARIGDRLCQFWNTTTVAVLRSRKAGSGYDIIGRGTMLQIGEKIDWDIPINQTMFLPSAPTSVELDVDLVMLNGLSFDVVSLPGSET